MASIFCRYKDTEQITNPVNVPILSGNTTTSTNVEYTYGISDIKVNGVSIGLQTKYPVSSSDVVEFVLITPLSPPGFLNYCDDLLSVKFSDDVTTLAELPYAHTTATTFSCATIEHCDSLLSIELGSGLENILFGYIVNDCPSLKTIVCKATTVPNRDTTDMLVNSIKEGGTLYYPTGSDYSSWLTPTTDDGLFNDTLGDYGWNGVEMDPEDMPDVIETPDVPVDPDDDNKLDDINMEVYVKDSPIVFGYQGGYKSRTISICGNAFKDGLQVSEFKNLETSADWLEFSYDEGGTDDGKTYYYYFSFNCSENMNADQRRAICSGEYVLTDGRMGTFSFEVYQDAIGLIDINGSNPLIFQAYERSVTKETEVYYDGISSVGNTSFNTNIDGISVNHSSASTESSGMLVGYEITMNEYNVYENDITGAIEYVRTDPDTSEDVIFEQQAVIRGCQYPFEVKKVIDGKYYDIGTKDGVKTILVPAEGENLLLSTYYPFYMQGGTVEQNAYKRISFNKNGNSGITWSTSNNTYTDMYVGPLQQDSFSIGFPKNTTEETKTATMEVEYITKDGITRKDSVNFVQLIGNGEDEPVDPDTPDGPYVTGTTTILYFNYDGTPKTTKEFDVYWYGDYYDRNLANDSSHFGISGEKIETTDDYVKYHYTVNCPKNTTSEVIIGSCYFNIKLDADTYGESFIVEFSQDANPEGENTPVVNAFTQSAKVKIDGTPEMASFTDIACGYAGVVIFYPSIEGDWIHLGDPTSASGIGYDTVMRYPISFDANDGEPRQGKITFSGLKTDGETLTSVCTISQAGTTVDPDEPDTPDIPDVPVDGEDYIGPIWKDVEFDFGLVDVVEYGVYTTVKERVGNQLIDVDKLLFMGRSYLRPNASSNKIIVNKICQDYMDIPLLEKDALALSGGYNKFILKSADGTRTYRTFRFINDWSYDDYFNTGILSHPILKENDKVYRNQLLPFTVFGASETVGVTYGIQYGGHKDEYGNVIPDWSNGVNVKNDVITELFPYSGRTAGAVSYTINGKKYNIVNECVQYVLYYLNPWGGYDWFPIRGKVIEKDRITAYTYQQNYNNQTLEFGKRRYLTEISKHFTLHTQWMSEDESSRMWYLLQSNIVYLHNLVENKIYPVVITNTEQEHKRKLRGTRISYAIEVDLSQTRERI